MRKGIFIGLAFIVGVVLTYFVMNKLSGNNTSEQSHVIAYQIERMNKMIVAEQSYSEIYTHSSKKSLPGLHNLWSSDKKVTLLVNAKAQATYDLSKMDVKVDSVNKVIRIKSIPPVDIKVFPDVSFYEMDQSVFNKFEKEDLNGIKKRAVAQVEQKIDRTSLKQEAHQQLIKNLEDIYLLAKIYGWKVEDESIYKNELLNRLK